MNRIVIYFHSHWHKIITVINLGMFIWVDVALVHHILARGYYGKRFFCSVSVAFAGTYHTNIINFFLFWHISSFLNTINLGIITKSWLFILDLISSSYLVGVVSSVEKLSILLFRIWSAHLTFSHFDGTITTLFVGVKIWFLFLRSYVLLFLVLLKGFEVNHLECFFQHIWFHFSVCRPVHCHSRTWIDFKQPRF